MIFKGKAGSFMAQVANLIEEDRGLNFAPIKRGVADGSFLLECRDYKKVGCKG
jgi:hypothetical protein